MSFSQLTLAAGSAASADQADVCQKPSAPHMRADAA